MTPQQEREGSRIARALAILHAKIHPDKSPSWLNGCECGIGVSQRFVEQAVADSDYARRLAFVKARAGCPECGQHSCDCDGHITAGEIATRGRY